MAVIQIYETAFAGLSKTNANTLFKLIQADAVTGGKIYATGLGKSGKPTGFAGAPSNSVCLTILQAYTLGQIVTLQVAWEALTTSQQFQWSINQERIVIYKPKSKLWISLPFWVQYWCNEYGGIGYGFPFFAASNILNSLYGFPLISVPMYPFTVRPGSSIYYVYDWDFDSTAQTLKVYQGYPALSNFHYQILAGPQQPPGCMKYTGNYKVIDWVSTPSVGWQDITTQYFNVYPQELISGYKIPVTFNVWYDLSGCTYMQLYSPYPIT